MPFYTMADGEQLFVREYGQSQPVLVLSGLGMLSWQWAAFLYPHQKNFRFIIPEWRGFGASSHCKIPQDLDAISSHWLDVQSVIQQLNLDQFIVIAYSMGATTTMHGLCYGDFSKHIAAYLHIDQTPKIPVDDAWAFGLLVHAIRNLLKFCSSFHHYLQNISILNSFGIWILQYVSRLQHYGCSLSSYKMIVQPV